VHLHLPHLPPAAVLLSAVYATAIAVALTHPGQSTLAGLVVLAGLTVRWVAYARRPARTTVAVTETATAVDAVLSADPDTAAAHVAA
jgi:uncharacterized membrane protein